MRAAFFFFAVLFFPTLLRASFFAFSQVAHLVLMFYVIKMASSAVCSMCDDEKSSPCGRSSSASCPADKVKTCFQQMKAEAMTKKACEGTNVSTEKPLRHHDLSSLRVKTSADAIRLIISMPGVSHEDLEVSVTDRMLHVKGETKRGPDTFCVDRSMEVPTFVDADTIECSHAEGELTVVMTRTVGKRIVVQHKVVDEARPETPGPASDGEWDITKDEHEAA